MVPERSGRPRQSSAPQLPLAHERDHAGGYSERGRVGRGEALKADDHVAASLGDDLPHVLPTLPAGAWLWPWIFGTAGWALSFSRGGTELVTFPDASKKVGI